VTPAETVHSYSADRKIYGGVQKLHFCMGQPESAVVQKYSFCTPGQSQNRIRGKLFDLLIFGNRLAGAV
jgi:hypothetical protein